MYNAAPLVSIVIPVYNGANYLADAINSALAQTYGNIEILVVNDGSNDGGKTREIAESYGDKIRYIEKPNGGVASALNVGVREMKGAYFSWLSHDDMYMPGKVKAQLDFLSTPDNARTIVYAHYCFINEQSTVTSTPPIKQVSPEAFRPYFIMGGLVHGCTLLIPKTAFDECGTFREDLKATQDYDLWFKFTSTYRFVFLPEVLVLSRQHAEQDTHKLKKVVVDEGNAILLRFLKQLPAREIAATYEKPLPVYYLDFAIKNARYGYCVAARRAFFLSLKNIFSMKWVYATEYFQKLSDAYKLLF